ncbi:MAG: dTDP-4-dehydrorhamnose 3,5-epimerase [Bacteroidales bacterium]|nr:dTDP-4-dehydrorhamnose 3,5-epimerase [Bacteroidales bacterium]
MKFTPLTLDGVWLMEPVRYYDARGYFCETFRKEEFERITGQSADFVQENESVSAYGVVRGLHFQAGDASQAKLVRVTEGTIIDVAVDLREQSPTYGRHICVELSAENGLSLYIPRGFAHGFAVISPTAKFVYKVDNYYCPEAERTLSLFDPTVGVEWPFEAEKMTLSPKDAKGVAWAECEKF